MNKSINSRLPWRENTPAGALSKSSKGRLWGCPSLPLLNAEEATSAQAKETAKWWWRHPTGKHRGEATGAQRRIQCHARKKENRTGHTRTPVQGKIRRERQERTGATRN